MNKINLKDSSKKINLELDEKDGLDLAEIDKDANAGDIITVVKSYKITEKTSYIDKDSSKKVKFKLEETKYHISSSDNKTEFYKDQKKEINNG